MSMVIVHWYYLTFMAVNCVNYENSYAAMRYTAGSRGVDENNEDYPSKEVRSNNNVLNLALPRKRVPKVTPHWHVLIWCILYKKLTYSDSQYFYFQLLLPSICSYSISLFDEFVRAIYSITTVSFLVLYRMKRSPTVQIPFTKGGGNSAVIWRRFVVKLHACNYKPKILMSDLVCCPDSPGHQYVE